VICEGTIAVLRLSGVVLARNEVDGMVVGTSGSIVSSKNNFNAGTGVAHIHNQSPSETVQPRVLQI
jgi:hypothetical protein